MMQNHLVKSTSTSPRILNPKVKNILGERLSTAGVQGPVLRGEGRGDLSRAYLQGWSQELGERGGERLRNGVGRDFLKKSLRDPVSESFRLKN